MSAHTYEIACKTLPDSRLFMADRDIQIAGLEAVAFIDRMSNYWQRDDLRGGWISGPSRTFDEERA